MKKIIQILAVLAFVLLLAGCGPTYYETPTRYESRYYHGNRPYYRDYPRYQYYPRHRHYYRRPGVSVQIGVHN